jgi:phosphohistidine phosphatase
MKRRIVLIRHAKSSWANPLQSDYDRPLNDRGLRDAPVMGQRLRDQGIIPDLIIASTAKRAAKTATLVAEAIGYDVDKIDWQDKLYHCIASIFVDIILTLDDSVKTVFIVAHNPGVSEFANEAAAKGIRIDHLPTCGVAGIEVEAAHWYDYNNSERQVFLYDYPKNEHG